MKYYVGLDVHSKACSFVIQAADGAVVGQGEIPTTRAGFEQLIGDHALPGGTSTISTCPTSTSSRFGSTAFQSLLGLTGAHAPVTYKMLYDSESTG